MANLSFIQPPERQSDFDPFAAIGRGLQIAGAVKALQGDSKTALETEKLKLENKKLQSEEDTRARKDLGEITPGDLFAVQSKFDVIKPSFDKNGNEVVIPGAQKYILVKPSGREEIYLKGREGSSPLDEAIKNLTIQQKIDELQKSKGEREVPGYSTVEGKRPTVDDAKTVKELNQAFLDSQKSVIKLKTLVQEHGTEFAPGEIKDQMAALVGDIKLKVKDIAKLGQLTEGDMKLIDSQVADPTAFANQGRSTESILKKLDTFLNIAQDKVDSAATSRGFKKISPDEARKELIRRRGIGVPNVK